MLRRILSPSLSKLRQTVEKAGGCGVRISEGLPADCGPLVVMNAIICRRAASYQDIFAAAVAIWESERAMKRASNKRGKARAQDATIWTLKVKLVFGLHAQGPWEATLEIDSSATLEDLHLAVQSAVEFDDDHMYMFYVARTYRSRDRTVFEHEDGTLQDTTLAELFPLPPDRKLFYWFDFGDDWKFSIGRARAAPQVAGKSRKYPRLVGIRGDTLVQYPSWD
jgi:hypothetical protein